MTQTYEVIHPNFYYLNCKSDGSFRTTVIECNLSFPSLAQNSFYHQLFKQKKSERFFKVFYDRMRLAQQEIRATVSVNMFELSTRKRDDDGSDATALHLKKGTYPTPGPRSALYTADPRSALYTVDPRSALYTADPRSAL